MARLDNESSNSSEELEDLSSDGSESESEPDKTSTPPPSSKKTQFTPNSSETESESVKPLASKLMDDDDNDNQPKKPRSKNPTSRYSPSPIKQSAGKRPAAEVDGGDNDMRRNKKKTVVAMPAPDGDYIVGEKKQLKQLFQRLWSENDEIELVQGMINYVKEKGKDPVADVNEFHEFVKKSLEVDVNTRQMTTKVRRLRKKFENNAARVENNGKVRSFSNPHEKQMYELSKSLWGSGSNNNVVMSSRVKKINVTPKTNKNQKTRKPVGSGNGKVEGVEVNPNAVQPKVVQARPSGNGLDHLGLMGPITDEVIMNKGLELLSGSKKVELQEKWKNLKVLELKNFVEKVNLLKEQAEAVLNVVENSGAK